MNQKTIGIGYFEEIKTVFSLAEGNLEQEYPNVMKSLQNADYTMYQELAPYLFYYFLISFLFLMPCCNLAGQPSYAVLAVTVLFGINRQQGDK